MTNITKCNGLEKYAVIAWFLFIRFYYFSAEKYCSVYSFIRVPLCNYDIFLECVCLGSASEGVSVQNIINVIIMQWFTISFLIGWKRKVNFRNLHLWRHLAVDFTILMSRTLKVTGNYVIYDRGAWFLRWTMSSSCSLCCLPWVKKQKHDFYFCGSMSNDNC